MKLQLTMAALLLCGGCSLTFYGLKEIKDQPKPKTAIAATCPEPKGQKPAVLSAAPKKTAPQILVAKEVAATKETAEVRTQAEAAPKEGGALEAGAGAKLGPDDPSASIATKP